MEERLLTQQINLRGQIQQPAEAGRRGAQEKHPVWKNSSAEMKQFQRSSTILPSLGVKLGSCHSSYSGCTRHILENLKVKEK